MSSAFDELIQAVKQVGIAVRHARLGGNGGGLAQFKGNRQLFIDLDATPDDQLDQTVKAAARIPELENVFLRPDVRAMIEAAK